MDCCQTQQKVEPKWYEGVLDYFRSENKNSTQIESIETTDTKLLPTTNKEVTLAKVNQHKNEQKTLEKIKKAAKDNYWDRKKNEFVKILAYFMPKSWLIIRNEDATGNPIILNWIKTMWLTYWKKVAFSIICTICIMYGILSMILFDSAQEIHTTMNVYYSQFAKPLDIEDSELNAWLEMYKLNNQPLQDNDFKSQYFSSPLYEIKQTGNVSINALHMYLQKLCPQNMCLCITSTHLGIPKNIVLLNNKIENNSLFLIDPKIQQTSSEIFKVLLKNGVSEKYPISVIIEYRKSDGIRSRDTFFKNRAVCIIKSIEINSRYC